MRSISALFLLTAALLTSGCLNARSSASCQACDGRTFSAADCRRYAETAGCTGSSVETPESGCSGRCVFTDCTGTPICAGLVVRDAGVDEDAAP